MRIAVVGAGVAGLGAAWLLDRKHEIIVYESAGRPGGHANTVEVESDGRRIAVDTGFIVYNEPSYPNLTRLFAALDVPTEPSDMSFSVSLDNGRFEYEGSLAGLIARRRNLASPRVWRMVRDVVRFYREAPSLLDGCGAVGPSLGGYLADGGYSEPFVRDHLLPMAAAIWSAPADEVLAFPARSFVRFFQNHGLLKLRKRPQWRTVTGGSREYVRRLVAPFGDRIRLDCRVKALRRTPAGVLLRDSDGETARFDQVILATHGDQALALLGEAASGQEREVLSAFRYRPNRALLHRDPRLMPRRPRAWASWNYLVEDSRAQSGAPAVTYWMNRLQNLDPSVPLFVSLNPPREPEPRKVLGEFLYDHPQYDRSTLEAQALLPSIQGRDRVWFCGSYCGFGFHEDALQAGFAVAAALGVEAPWAKEVIPVSPSARAAAPLPPSRAAA